MHIFIVLFIALLAVLPELILGTNRLDAGWNFSYAVNAMEAPFNHFTQNNSPYLYPYFQIPFAALSIKYGSVLFHFFIIIGLASITYYKTKSNPKYALLVTLGVLTSYELLCFRSEHFSIFFTLLLYFFIFENHNTRVKIILIPSLIAAIHPLHAFMTLLALLGTEKKYTKHPFLILITFLICSVLLFLAHIFFPENIYTTKLIGFIIHNDFTALFKFIKYNALSIILFFWVINKKWTADLLVSVFAIVLACSIIGVSQYFALLFIPLILTSISHGQKLQNNALSYILILSSIFFNQIHPLFVLFENKEYVKKTHQIQHYISEFHIPNKVFLGTTYGNLMYHQANSRMLLHEKNLSVFFDTLAVSDEIIITTSVDRDQVIKHLDSNADSIKYSITKPLDPSPGKLSLTSLYSQRTDSIGLWVFQIERIGEITPQ